MELWEDKTRPLQHRISDLWKAEYLDASYKLGGMTKKEGYDCFSLVYTMLCKLGYELKPYWGALDITNYWIDYDLNLLSGWFNSIGGETVNANYRIAGDILLCKLANDQILLSVYLGPDICSFVNGETNKVGACPFTMLSSYIMEVRRCLR